MTLNINTGGGKNKLPPRLLLLGQHKVGKTTFASQAPNNVFLPTEWGCDQIEGASFLERATTWEDLLASIGSLITEDHDYKWLTIDTLDGAEDLCRRYVTTTHFKNTEALFNSYGAGYKVAPGEFKRLFDGIDKLRREKKMGIILLCHVGVNSVNSPIDGNYSEYTGAMNKHMWATPCNECDMIGYAHHDFTVVGANDSEGVKGKAKTQSNERYIQFKGHAALAIGCNSGYEMPDKIKLSWTDFEDNLNKCFSKEKGAK